MTIRELIFNLLFTVIGWLASVIALWITFTNKVSPSLFVLGSAIIAVFAIIYFWLQIRTYKNEQEQIRNKQKNIFVHSTPEAVHQYLYDWIKNGRRTVIFTRDFSWADYNQDMLSMLQEKARKHELIICLHKSTPITDELQKLGAEVYTHNLKSRFTIIHYGTHSPQITVGSWNDRGEFVNERYTQQSNPNAYNVFVELFESTKDTFIAKSISK